MTDSVSKPLPLTETPEFKEAVAKAASEAARSAAEETAKTILASLAAQRQAAGPDAAPAPRDEMAWAEGLAMAIAQLTDQGTNRKRLAPEVVKQRTDAAARLQGLLIAAQADGRIAEYTLRNKTYLGHQVIEPFYMDPATKSPKPTRIEWAGMPNEAMVPINDTAREIFAAFSDSIGNVVTLAPRAAPFMTPNGLTINGIPPMRRDGQTQVPPVADNGLKIGHLEQRGQYKTVQVLGTIAEPARQTA